MIEETNNTAIATETPEVAEKEVNFRIEYQKHPNGIDIYIKLEEVEKIIGHYPADQLVHAFKVIFEAIRNSDSNPEATPENKATEA